METFLKIAIGVAIGVSLLALILMKFEESTTMYKHGYKQGQVDAINGRIKYHKVEQKDFSVTWEEIKDSDK